MSQPTRIRRCLVTAGTALAVTVTMSGCGDEVPDVDDFGAIGPDEVVSEDIEVLQVQLEYPLDGVHEVGEAARLFLGVSNTGTTDDALLDVEGPAFRDAVFMVDGQPATTIPVPAEDNVYIGAEGAPSIVLEDLQEELRSSQSIPVTFVFAEAGEVTVEAMVSAERTTPGAPFDFPDPAEDPSF